MSYATATVGTAGRGTASTQAVSMTSVPAGAMVVVSAVLWNSNGAVTWPATLTDNQGNTFTRRGTAPDVDTHVSSAQYEGVVPTLVASWSLTLTQTGGGGSFQWDAVPLYYTGNPTSSEFSQSAVASAIGSTSLTIGPTATTGTSTELAVVSVTDDASSTTVFSSATLTTGYTWIYRQNDDSTLQAHGIAEGIQGNSSLNFHSVAVSATVSGIVSGDNTGTLCTYNAAAGGVTNRQGSAVKIIQSMGQIQRMRARHYV